jgi:hypothetical protein
LTLPPPHRLLLTLTLALLLSPAGGCSDRPDTAVQLVLAPDAEISSEAELLKWVSKLQVVVDADGAGLQGLGGAGKLEGGGTAQDWDGDGKLEVVFDPLSLRGDELPVLEIGLEHNAGRLLHYRAFGYDEGAAIKPDQAAAMGGAAASSTPGEVRKVGMPFNLRSWVLPPRVVLALPADGAQVPGNLISVTLIFSATIDKASLKGNITIEGPGGESLTLDPTLETMLKPGAGSVPERRSLLRVDFTPPSYGDGTYKLRVGTGLKSTAGRTFDQDPSTTKAEPFTSRFTILARSGGSKCTWCPEGYVCHDTLNGCVPEQTCKGGCVKGSVCDTSVGWCVEDCRPFEVCPAPSMTCDAKSGLCK